MKRIATTLSALVATLIISSLPVIGDEGSMGKTMDQGQQTQKNECLLVSRNCGDSVDTIQQRINRLQTEIGRGSNVYTNDELRILNRKLEDQNRIMDELITSGGG